MSSETPLVIALDLAGTFAFAPPATLPRIGDALRRAVTLGMITALGGGIIRDILLDSLPPATFSDPRYLTVAASGSLVAFGFGRRLDRWQGRSLVLDAAGLSLFALHDRE